MANVINKINVGSTEYAIASTAYATCSTAAATATKKAYILNDTTATSGFTLTTGVTVYVEFTYANTAANPKLQINKSSTDNTTDAKAITRNGSAIQAGDLQSGCIYAFTYDGTNWELCGSPAVAFKIWGAND
jgi:hypothetical protein